MEDVARYVDRIIVINDGKILFDGTPKQVFQHYKELESVGLAAPQVNLCGKGSKRERLGSLTRHATTVEEAKECDSFGNQEEGKDMLRDITLGQYYPADSVIHKMDPQRQTVRDDRIYHFTVFVSEASVSMWWQHCFWLL